MASGGRLNDPAQYDELAGEWWDPAGAFAMLHWLAAARAERIPPASTSSAVLVDLACGGGLMGPHVARLGYRHIGVDIGLPGLELARSHGLLPLRASVLAVPLADGCADVVVAGEVLEHVEDDVAVLAECARLLRPGGLLVLDTIAATRLARLVAVRIGDCTTRPSSWTAGGCSRPPTGSASTSGWSACAHPFAAWWPGCSAGRCSCG
jgi:2-polyprenyl-6-hydroxyphenyl methylase/3-demethylubiquinone-9 3-methyltransferase